MEATAVLPDNALKATHVLRAHFDTGATRSFQARRAALKALKVGIIKHEEELLAAMNTDMRKPRFEAYMSDIGLVLAEIDHALKHLRQWMKPRAVPSPLAIQLAESELHPEPLGVVLIIAPWNYPVLLLLSPLIGAIAAGNCALLKPSEDAPATAVVVDRIIQEALPSGLATVIHGKGSEVVPHLMKSFRFDHVFFTGSPKVGREVMLLAADRLTPVTLELGGKCPAIVDRKVDVKSAARRIAWSKYFNAGQTCIATDHVLVHSSLMEPFLEAFAEHVRRFYGADPQHSPDYARMINGRRFDVVKDYLAQGQLFLGGGHDAADRYIAPSVLTNVQLDSPVMREEIFGPVLPVIQWTEREEVIAITKRNPNPLAAYIFSSDGKAQRYFRDNIPFGGGCINHCMLQFGPAELPFGGVGGSGMGRYHGYFTFELFSNRKGMVHASTLIDPALQYPPYTKLKEKVLRRAL